MDNDLPEESKKELKTAVLIGEAEDHLSMISPNRKRVGFESVFEFYSAFKNINKAIEREEYKFNANVAYLKSLEEDHLFPKKGSLVTMRGKNKEINAKYTYMSDKKAKAFSQGLGLT